MSEEDNIVNPEELKAEEIEISGIEETPDFSDLDREINEKFGGGEIPSGDDKPIIATQPNGKLLKKEEVMNKIMTLQATTQGIEKHPRSHYAKMKVGELRKLYEEMGNKTQQVPTLAPSLHESGEVLRPTGTVLDQMTPQQREQVFSGVNKLFKNPGSVLYHNLFWITKMVEKQSIRNSDKIGWDLEGLSDDIKEAREEIEPCLTAVSEEYSEYLSYFMNPALQLGVVLAGTVGTRIIVNMDKKEKKRDN